MEINEARTAKCLHCGRTRRFATAQAAAKSSAYGRICRMRIAAAAMAGAVKHFAAAAIEKAKQLISDGGIVPTGREGVYRTVSSTGGEFYLTAPSACNCPAGRHDRVCYHRAAATMLAVSTRRAA